MNRLEKIIPNLNISFKAIGLNNFDYKMLMYNNNIDIETDEAKAIIDKYNELDLKKYFIITKSEDEDEKEKNLAFMYEKIRQDILAVNKDEKYVVDVLVKYLYWCKNSKYKTTLWSSFGDVIVDNIKKNIDKKLAEGYILCSECNKLIKPTSNRQKYCKHCWKEKEREDNRRYARESMRRIRQQKMLRV